MEPESQELELPHTQILSRVSGVSSDSFLHLSVTLRGFATRTIQKMFKVSKQKLQYTPQHLGNRIELKNLVPEFTIGRSLQKKQGHWPVMQLIATIETWAQPQQDA